MENKVILIVDDDKPIVRMLARRLKKIGLIVHTAENGQEGVELTMALQPDIVLMDIRMPCMDGYEMVKTLRAEGYKKLIVACSASVRAQDSERTIIAGCDYFLLKPISTDFEEIIQNLILKYNPD